MTETVEFNGVKFRRYPDAKQRSDRVYFNPGIGDRQRGVRRLHEEIWMDTHGPIPAGSHIHHKDGDPLNNDIANLECLTAAEHGHLHHAGVCTDAKRENLDRIRPLASAWHRSEEGREWHRQHAREVAANQTPVERVCEQCSTAYSVIPKGTNRFCSNACKSAWRRAAGIDDETRTCDICGTEFVINRYAKKKTCSVKCAGRAQSRTKTTRP